MSIDSVSTGDVVKAQWQGDHAYHRAVVEDVLTDGVLVRFTQIGSVQLVPLAQIRSVSLPGETLSSLCIP